MPKIKRIGEKFSVGEYSSMKKIGRTMGKLNSKCVSKARMYHSMKFAYHLNLFAKNVEEYVQVFRSNKPFTMSQCKPMKLCQRDHQAPQLRKANAGRSEHYLRSQYRKHKSEFGTSFSIFHFITIYTRDTFQKQINNLLTVFINNGNFISFLKSLYTIINITMPVKIKHDCNNSAKQQNIA